MGEKPEIDSKQMLLKLVTLLLLFALIFTKCDVFTISPSGKRIKKKQLLKTLSGIC